jgi:integrase
MSSDPMVLLDAAGPRRSPATIPGHLTGRAPRNKGMQYPPDPPRPEEIILVMRQAGHDRHGLRMRALISVLWRAGLRISEALALNETDIDTARGSLLIRHGLCRIRHKPRYAEVRVMRSLPSAARVLRA